MPKTLLKTLYFSAVCVGSDDFMFDHVLDALALLWLAVLLHDSSLSHESAASDCRHSSALAIEAVQPTATHRMPPSAWSVTLLSTSYIFDLL
jgi:hypothetical protein